MAIHGVISLLGFVLVCLGAWLFLPSAPTLPVLSAGDWPPLIMMFLGTGWSLLGAVQQFRFGRSGLAKVGLSLLAFAAAGISVLTAFWVLDFSFRLPEAPALEDKPLPAFELVDQHGVTHSGRTLAGKPLVIIFGRGVW